MIGLINFYYSEGMLSLYVDGDIGNGNKFSDGYFITYDDVWAVKYTIINNIILRYWICIKLLLVGFFFVFV